MKQKSTHHSGIASVTVTLLTLVISLHALAGERLLIQLRDFTQVEVKAAGFTLPHDASIHIEALGGGKKHDNRFDRVDLFAYGWILNSETRERVWVMNYDNTENQNKDRMFNGSLQLPAGSYEVYFAAYGFQGKSGFGNIELNIDRRENHDAKEIKKEWGPFSWFYNFFTDDFYKDWEKRAKNWGIDISLSDPTVDEVTFNAPKEFSNILYKSSKAGENDYVKQGFSLSKPTSIHVYALGEGVNDDELVDYGWIVSTKTHKRVWEMREENVTHAGGAKKNKKCDETISLDSGNYVLMYVTDGSHSYLDWNSAPPNDPFHYGITLTATNAADKLNFKLSEATDFKNIIVELTRIGNDETRTSSFNLKEETEIRIYALGERSLSNREMADYGWIINAKTREKVWVMEADQTEHAGGSSKNRMIDETITLQKGTYTVYFKTDDSHAYNEWNASAPIDRKHWGITIMGEGVKYNPASIEKDVSPKRSGVLAQIIQVRDGEDNSERFKLEQETHVRVYALGEGQNREMFDYGWIENALTGEVVWEMTYSMTFHAGGSRKNRMVNTTIVLGKGEYLLRYVSDDSHSYNDWNMDAPDDPTMWGITLYKENE
ncbi:MAG: hypothetical protein HYZ34_13810 [Ignavibacteriae bacterium]|nr:hypothetical protein [Ignavibacteriota bacterium]